MAIHQLTERRLRAAALPAGKGEADLHDGGGLLLRLRPAAGGQVRRSWLFVYQRGGSRQRIGLGSYPDVTLAAARERAARYRELLAAGIAPAGAATPAADPAAPLVPRTVDDLADRWLSDYIAHRRKDKGAAVRAALALHVRPAIGATRLVDVRKLHVLHIIDGLVRQDKGRTARATLAMLRQMFRWGISRDYCATDPTAALVKAEFGAREQPRDRVLAPTELQALARHMQASRRGGPAGRQRTIPVVPLPAQAAAWVMLGTLARVGELSQARWEHVDFGAGTWRIPAENAKNGREHLVHLSPFAARHLRHLHVLAAGSPWVLPGRDPREHLDVKAITKQLTDRQREQPRGPKGRATDAAALLLPGGRWTPHDLRRTGASMMRALDIAPAVIERCLNHVEQDKMVRTYQVDELLPQRKAAFDLLGQRLDALVPASATAHLAPGSAA